MKAMSKQDEKQKLPFIFYIFLAVAIIGLFLGAMGVIGSQNNSNNIKEIEIQLEEHIHFDWRTDKEFWKYVNDNYISEGELNSTKKEIKSYAKLNKDSIVAIKEDIKNKFPQASTVEQEQQTVISDTPFLTLTIEKSEWTLGATLVFTGTANIHDLVSITVKLPDRKLLHGDALPSQIIDGTYRIEVETELDHAPGTWTAYAKQGKEQSKTLNFKVE